MKITYDYLADHGACAEHLQLFQETFPDGAELSEENWREAVDAGLPVYWLRVVLRDELGELYTPVWHKAYAVYGRRHADACAKHTRDCALVGWLGQQLADDVLQKECAAAWAECNRQCGPYLFALLQQQFREEAQT